MNRSDRSNRCHHVPPDLCGCARANRRFAFSWWLVALLPLAAIAGCGPIPAVLSDSSPEAVSDQDHQNGRQDVPHSPDSEATPAVVSADSGVVEHWAASFIGGHQVGFTHLTSERVLDGGQWVRRYRYRDELKMKRYQDTTVVRTKLECVERVEGGLLRFRSEVETGPSAMVTEGVFDRDQLRMDFQTAGRTEQIVLAWDARWGGFFADHQSLKDQPMKPREIRRLKVLLPILHQAGEIRLEAVGYESVRLLDGTRQLLRINVTTRAGETSLRSIVWSDDRGQVWKTRDLQLDLEAYRCDRATALRPTTGEGFDLGAGTLVRLTAPMAKPHQTTRAVYLASLTQGQIGSVFVRDGSQSIRVVGEDAVELTVVSIRPQRPKRFPESTWRGPTEADRGPTAMIQSDDPRIVQMASEIAPTETDHWRLACELERFVKRTVQLKNYSTAMATAAEVAESLEGDCTEHAMLLAALCRARQIPARVAIGLVYYPPAQGFAYHMWTEVWIADRWIGLDATLGDGGIGAAHLKLAVSSMDGSTAFADMLPIVQVIGRLQLRVLSADHS